ncbi:LexA family protein [Sediminitomix flava]|uniref:LexA family protein n=1 Tax=Sediminitomix flava TaxID=379075 RepID=UPI001304E4D0|nr:translesion error-prone DNA polymerase V autoproteolytic subunit [Sediminitomix flava]
MIKLFSSIIPAGYPSPSDEFMEEDLRIEEYLIRNQPATFMIRVKGESMHNAGIFDNDLLIVDRSVLAKHNDVILAWLNGEFTVKRFLQTDTDTWLKAENYKFRPRKIDPKKDTFRVWGVITFSIRHHKFHHTI